MVYPENGAYGRFQYSDWFKPFAAGFEDLITTLLISLKGFSLCPELLCFFNARDQLDSYLSLLGLFDNLSGCRLENLELRIGLLNHFVNLIRKQLKSQDVLSAIRNRNEKSDDNFKSCSRLINGLFERFNRLTVLRLDFGLKPPDSSRDSNLPEDLNADFHQAHQLEYLKSQIERFLNNRRNNAMLRKIIGYIVKFEHGLKKGHHAHCIFVLNGDRHDKDGYYAQEITKYWLKLTENKGCFYNCNRARHKYRKEGIGLISYKDTQKRENLMNYCISYLCKTEQFFLFQPLQELKSRGYRTIQLSQLPAKKNAGRPRQSHNNINI